MKILRYVLGLLTLAYLATAVVPGGGRRPPTDEPAFAILVAVFVEALLATTAVLHLWTAWGRRPYRPLALTAAAGNALAALLMCVMFVFALYSLPLYQVALIGATVCWFVLNAWVLLQRPAPAPSSPSQPHQPAPEPPTALPPAVA
jgi:hypothetical protein